MLKKTFIPKDRITCLDISVAVKRHRHKGNKTFRLKNSKHRKPDRNMAIKELLVLENAKKH